MNSNRLHQPVQSMHEQHDQNEDDLLYKNTEPLSLKSNDNSQTISHPICKKLKAIKMSNRAIFQLVIFIILLLVLIGQFHAVYTTYTMPNPQDKATIQEIRQKHIQKQQSERPLFQEMARKQKEEKFQKQIRDVSKRTVNLMVSEKQLAAVEQRVKTFEDKYQQQTVMAQDEPFQHSKQTLQQDIRHIDKRLNIKKEQGRFPKLVWMYIQSQLSAQSFITQLTIDNLIKAVSAQGYDFYLITNTNYNYIMSNRNEQQIGYVLSDLWHIAYETNSTTNLKDHTLNIKKNLINLIMLSESGGILIDKDVLLTEDLGWLEKLDQLNYVNKGRMHQPHVVGFHYINYTAAPERIQLNQYQYRDVHLYPSLDPYFMAVSKQGCQFIKEVLQQYYVLLQNYEQVKQIMSRDQLYMSQIQGNDPYYESYFIAFSLIIKRKQNYLDYLWRTAGKVGLRPLAIDHYGIYTINRLYGPLRYRFIFSDKQNQDLYFTLSRLKSRQLDADYGELKMIAFVPFKDKIEQFLVEADAGNKTYALVKGSFLQKYCYPNITADNEHMFTGNMPKDSTTMLDSEKWNNLPLKLFIYLPNENSANILQKLCIYNLNESARASGFRLTVITPKNLFNFTQQDIIAELHRIFKNNVVVRDHPNLIIELIKLAVIQYEGGVWIDLPAFTIQNLDWLVNIRKSTNILHKFSTLPKVLLQYHPVFSPFPWNIDSTRIEVNYQLYYQTNFIAAQASNNLISKWLEELVINIYLPEIELQDKFRNKYGLEGFNASLHKGQLSRYTLISVIKSFNIGGLQDNLHEATMKWLGLWVLNSFAGSEKLKELTNFQKGYDYNNLYLWSKSQNFVKSLLGQFNYFVSLNQQQQYFLNNELSHLSIDSPIPIHPNSFFYNYLFNPKTIQAINQHQPTELIYKYSSNHFPRIIWLYTQGYGMDEEYMTRWVQNVMNYSRGYIIQFVHLGNYLEFIEQSSKNKIAAVLEQVDKMESFSIQQKYNVKKTIVIMSILKQKGGIHIDRQLYLTQDLTWLQQTNTTQYAGINSSHVKVIAFYQNNKNENTQQKNRYPSVYQLFIAVQDDARYIDDVLSKYLSIVMLKKMAEDKIEGKTNNVEQKQQQLYSLAQYLVFLGKENQMRSANPSQPFKIEDVTQFYGLTLINSLYFPQRLNYFYGSQPRQHLLQILTKNPQTEIEGYFGNIKFMLNIGDPQQMITYINKNKVYFNSTIANYVLLRKEQDRLMIFPAFKKMVQLTLWDSLQKKFWFCEPNIKSPNSNMLKVKMQKIAFDSNYLTITINSLSAGQFMDQLILQKIKKCLNDDVPSVDRDDVQMLMLKLALLYQYGGVVFPNSYLPVGKLNWIHNIKSLYSDYLYNNFGSQPEMLMFFSTDQPYHYNFTFNKREGIKQIRNITLLPTFIATEPQNMFLLEWLDQIAKFVPMSILSIKEQFYKMGLEFPSRKQTADSFAILVQKYIIRKLQKEMIEGDEKYSSVYEKYGIWCINGDIGPNKPLVNFDRTTTERELLVFNIVLPEHSKDLVYQLMGRPQYFSSLSELYRNKLSAVPVFWK